MTESNKENMREKIERLEGEIMQLRAKMLEQNRLEEQLIQAQKMESLANLSAGIAHDFNNILQSILGYTQIALIHKKPDDPDYELFSQIEHMIHKGSQLTRQFLTFGRKIEPKFKRINLNHKIREIKGLLQRTIPKMIKIEILLSDDLKDIYGDAGQIEQVLMNLSINAKDAMPEGGSLIFRTENVQLGENGFVHLNAQPGDYVLLSVSDTGIGMTPQTIKHIFEPFFTTKNKGKGTGLGLPMVYAIVRNHHGIIDCISKVGEGTTLKLYFPAMKSREKKPGKVLQMPEGASFSGTETLLVVEDDVNILELWNHILPNYGYKVFPAADGENAIRVYTKNSIDVIILDLEMPGMGGIKCLEKLLTFDRDARIIISSGYALNGNIKKAMDRGALAFLPKPVGIDDLLKTVRQVVERTPFNKDWGIGVVE